MSSYSVRPFVGKNNALTILVYIASWETPTKNWYCLMWSLFSTLWHQRTNEKLFVSLNHWSLWHLSKSTHFEVNVTPVSKGSQKEAPWTFCQSWLTDWKLMIVEMVECYRSRDKLSWAIFKPLLAIYSPLVSDLMSFDYHVKFFGIYEQFYRFY